MTERAAFRWLWAGQTTSVFGSAITRLAIPTIAVLTLRASPLGVGALEAAEFAAFPLLGLVAGVWVDRLSRRGVMLAADAMRACVLATIPVAAAMHALGYPLLFAVAACSGAASVFFAVAYQSIVPSLVPPERLETANSRLELTNSASQIAGNGLAGWLIGALGAPLTVAIDAASYVVSVATLLAMRVHETHHRSGEPRTPFVAAMREGLSVVFGRPVLVRIMIATALSNLGFSIVNAVYLIYAYRILGLSPALVGLVFAVANVGFIGAFFAPRIAQRFGVARTILAAMAVAMASYCTLPLALPLAHVVPPVAVLFGAEFCVTLCTPIYNITQVSLRHRLVAPELHGRMNATLRTMVWGTLPVGTLLGGAIGNVAGVVPALVAGAAVALCAILPLLTRPVRELAYSSVMSAADAG